ncbi:MAG: hypothetical protein PHG66_00115 [Candidatus Colwellbacteria bacterium]|nr:hypothetical protein [Candidatus Colwellbacteria bacterium]
MGNEFDKTEVKRLFSEITTISETGKFFGGEVASLTNIERV